MLPLTDASRIVASPDVMMCELGGQAVLLDAKGTYFGLNAVGSHVWSLVQEAQSVGDIQADLLRQFAVDAARCREDLTGFLDSVIDAGLVRVVDPVRP